ncbi:MAG TPA: DUF5676 family membrane protein [Acidocella sp.]|nr:DUF5676 family membrane protein [Acidocella sp.]
MKRSITMVAARFAVAKPAVSPVPALNVHMIPVAALGMALSLLLVISYLICITTYFIPGLPVSHAMLTVLLPGFELLSWQSFLLGLVESFAWGWYVALIFGPIYNFFILRLR